MVTHAWDLLSALPTTIRARDSPWASRDRGKYAAASRRRLTVRPSIFELNIGTCCDAVAILEKYRRMCYIYDIASARYVTNPANTSSLLTMICLFSKTARSEIICQGLTLIYGAILTTSRRQMLDILGKARHARYSFSVAI